MARGKWFSSGSNTALNSNRISIRPLILVPNSSRVAFVRTRHRSTTSLVGHRLITASKPVMDKASHQLTGLTPSSSTHTVPGIIAKCNQYGDHRMASIADWLIGFPTASIRPVYGICLTSMVLTLPRQPIHVAGCWRHSVLCSFSSNFGGFHAAIKQRAQQQHTAR